MCKAPDFRSSIKKTTKKEAIIAFSPSDISAYTCFYQAVRYNPELSLPLWPRVSPIVIMLVYTLHREKAGYNFPVLLEDCSIYLELK
jgi:hypothetical protein